MQWNHFYLRCPISKDFQVHSSPFFLNEGNEKRQTRLRHTLARFPDGFTFYVKKRFLLQECCKIQVLAK